MTSSRKAGNRFGYSKKDTKENLGSCNNMEELLSKLIERGWKPMWIEKEDIETIDYDKKRKKISIWYMNWETPSKWDFDWLFLDLRQLTAKESWLWKFVCENHLYIYKMWENKNFVQDHFKNEYNECCYQYLYDKSCYEYYLLESSLKDNEELEDFLLSNIKVDE